MPELSNNRTISQVAINAPAGNTDLVAAPGVGLKIYVIGVVFSVDTAATTVKFTEGTGPTDLTGTMEFPDGGGLVAVGANDTVVLATNTANSKLTITTATGAARGWLRYYIAA